MTVRTSSRTVTFKRVFSLPGYREKFPAGDYIIETDEELIEGLSFPAYRRILTLLCFRPGPQNPSGAQFLNVDPEDLDAALERDQAAGGMGDTDPSATREQFVQET